MDGRVALITGAGSGIGRAASLALLRDGYRVALVGRRRDRLEQTASESGASGRALVLPADITDHAAVRAVFATVVERWSRLDVLFNNAGMATPPVPLEDLPLEQWNAVVELNRRAAQALVSCPHRLVLVPGATHLFEEPGALEAVSDLATEWFLRHLVHAPDHAGDRGRGRP